MSLFNSGLANVRGTQTGTTTPISKKGFGYVYSVILDETHPRIREKIGATIEDPNVSLIGCIEYRFSSDTVSSEENLPVAYPFDKNFINLPVRNETVEIWQGEGGQNFYRRIGEDITPNINADDKAISKNFSPKSSKSTTSKDYQRVQATSISRTDTNESTKFDGYGDYFKEERGVHKLKLYEGDTLLQSRFGQSIRFSAFNNTERQFSPIIVIRNGENSISKNRPITEPTEEDFNRDGSIIALTSNQFQIPFQPGTIDDGGTSDFETKPISFKDYPKKIIGDNILISSNRIILSAKSSELIFYSKKNYGFISDAALSIDNKLGININVGDDIICTTNDRNININTGNGKINLGNTELEPIVKGQKLVDILKELIDVIIQQVYLTPSGPSATGPTNIADFNAIKSRLDTILSELNKTS
jgi:hypothetical protein